MMFVEQAATSDWPTVRAALEQKRPPLGAVATAAFTTPSDEVRVGLLEVLARTDDDGLRTVHRLALRGDASALAEVEADQLDLPVQVSQLANSLAMGRWTAAHIAAASGHFAVLETLRTRGADLDVAAGNRHLRPLDVAVRFQRPAAVVWLLEAGCRPGPGTVESLLPGVPDAVLEPLLSAGMDLDDAQLPALLMNRPESLDDKLAFIGRLHGHGLTLDTQLVYDMASMLERYDAPDIPMVVAHLLGLGDLDLERPVHRSPEGTEDTLLAYSLREWPLAAVQLLVDAGADVPVMRVPSYAPDASDKRALLDQLGRAPGEPERAEFLTLGDDELTVERIVRRIAGPGPTIAGISLGTSSADVRTAVGAAPHEAREVRIETTHDPRGRRTAEHELVVGLADDRATAVWYGAFFPDKDTARAVFDALKQAYTDGLGRPKGRKAKTWAAGEARLELSTSRETPTRHAVRLHLRAK